MIPNEEILMLTSKFKGTCCDHVTESVTNDNLVLI